MILTYPAKNLLEPNCPYRVASVPPAREGQLGDEGGGSRSVPRVS